MLTQARLKEVLDYDPDTGIFTWLVGGGRRGIGKNAGTINKHGHLRIKLMRRDYYNHRLAFLWMTGAWPERDVDHINGVKTDNRWVNLRTVTRSENNQNLGSAYKNNKCRALGVYWSKHHNKWHARITTNHSTKHIGYYNDFNEAQQAYMNAKHELHPTHQRLRAKEQ